MNLNHCSLQRYSVRPTIRSESDIYHQLTVSQTVQSGVKWFWYAQSLKSSEPHHNEQHLRLDCQFCYAIMPPLTWFQKMYTHSHSHKHIWHGFSSLYVVYHCRNASLLTSVSSLDSVKEPPLQPDLSHYTKELLTLVLHWRLSPLGLFRSIVWVKSLIFPTTWSTAVGCC